MNQLFACLYFLIALCGSSFDGCGYTTEPVGQMEDVGLGVCPNGDIYCTYAAIVWNPTGTIDLTCHYECTLAVNTHILVPGCRTAPEPASIGYHGLTQFLYVTAALVFICNQIVQSLGVKVLNNN